MEKKSRTKKRPKVVLKPAKLYVTFAVESLSESAILAFVFCATLYMIKCLCVADGTFAVGTYLTHVQTCDNVRVQSATPWTASVHT